MCFVAFNRGLCVPLSVCICEICSSLSNASHSWTRLSSYVYISLCVYVCLCLCVCLSLSVCLSVHASVRVSLSLSHQECDQMQDASEKKKNGEDKDNENYDGHGPNENKKKKQKQKKKKKKKKNAFNDQTREQVPQVMCTFCSVNNDCGKPASFMITLDLLNVTRPVTLATNFASSTTPHHRPTPMASTVLRGGGGSVCCGFLASCSLLRMPESLLHPALEKCWFAYHLCWSPMKSR